MKETFPPRARFKWLLITIRLSIISFAGIARTLVAVGTLKDASMLCTTRAETPRIGSSVDALGVTNTGTGFTTGSAGVAGCCFTSRTTGCDGATTAGVGVTTGATGATGAGVATGVGVTTGAATGAVGVTDAAFCTDLGTGGVPARGAFGLGVEPDPPGAGVKSEKKSHHALSTDCGSTKYLSYISSTSHSFAPNSLAASLPTTLPTIEFTCGLESDADTGPPSVLAQNSL